MEFKIRRAEVGDAKVIHDFEITLQQEMHDLYQAGVLVKFARMELRDEKVHPIASYKKWIGNMTGKKDSELNQIWYVAEANGKVVGDVYATIKERKGMLLKKEGYLDMLYLQRPYRRRGCATALMNKVLDWFREKKVKYVTLMADRVNEPANKFYKNLGFEVCQYNYRLEL